MRPSRAALLAAGAALALLLAACGEGGAEGADGTGAAGGSATVAVADSDLGSILVDADGRTLYAFLPDEGGTSTCYDDCAANWPPLTVEGDPVAGDGADAGLLGTTEREDGSVQVTYGGWPLYRYAADMAAGDIAGQGVGDVWFVVSPDGAPVQDAAAAAGDVPGGGYGYGSGKG